MPTGFDYRNLLNPFVSNYTEQVYAPPAGSSFTVALVNGTIHVFTTNANATVTLPPASKGKSFTVAIVYGGTHTLTWAGGTTLKWANGTTPTATSSSGKVDVFTFLSYDGLTTLGFTGGLNF